MTLLRWTPEAASNLESIYLYLMEHNPSFTKSTIQTLYDSVQSLRSFPNRGKHGRVSGTREYVLPRLPFIIVYRFGQTAIEILHIYHAAQDR